MILASRHSDEKGALETCREVEARGQRAEAIHLDLSTLPDGAEAIETLIARFGRLDVLVNNAGAMAKAPFLEMAFDDWRNILPSTWTARFSARRLRHGRW